VSGEESLFQIKARIDRLKIKSGGIKILSTNDLGNILESVEKENPDIIIVDSIQSIGDSNNSSLFGSILQVKLSAQKLQFLVKQKNIPLILTSQVTKSGIIAGPKTLEHLVDTVIYLQGDKYQTFRILKVIKNRFGSINVVKILK